MRASPKQLDFDPGVFESLRNLANAAKRTERDLKRRLRKHERSPSDQIVMQQTQRTIRKVRGLSMPPCLRAEVDGLYVLVRNALRAA